MGNLFICWLWLGPLLTIALPTGLSLDAGSSQELKGVVALEGSTDYGTWATFSSDRTMIAAVGDYSEVKGIASTLRRASEIKVWDAATGKVKARLQARRVDAIPATFSGDGTLLAAAVAPTTIRVWDVSTAKEKGTLTVPADIVLAVAFSPHGKYLATGNTDDTVTLFELASGRGRTLVGHTSTVFCIGFSPNGKLLGSGSRDGTVRLWDLVNGAEVIRLREHPGAVLSIAFSADGKYLASDSADLKQKANPQPTVTLWELPGGDMKARLKGCGSPAFCNNGKLLATIKEGGGALEVWNTLTAKRQFAHELKAGATALAVTFSGDDDLLAVVKEDSQLKLVRLRWGRESS